MGEQGKNDINQGTAKRAEEKQRKKARRLLKRHKKQIVCTFRNFTKREDKDRIRNGEAEPL